LKRAPTGAEEQLENFYDGLISIGDSLSATRLDPARRGIGDRGGPKGAGSRCLVANLIGIDADFRIHVADRLLEIHDGPFLELGLKQIDGTLIEMPRRIEDRPDRDRLPLRFEQFKKVA
jgi:hypothetical protein